MRTQLAEAFEEREALRDQIQNLTQENNLLKEQLSPQKRKLSENANEQSSESRSQLDCEGPTTQTIEYVPSVNLTVEPPSEVDPKSDDTSQNKDEDEVVITRKMWTFSKFSSQLKGKLCLYFKRS